MARAEVVQVENKPFPCQLDCLLMEEQVDDYRKIYCRFYNDCLTKVIQKKWYGWTCRRCMAYVPEPEFAEEEQKKAR